MRRRRGSAKSRSIRNCNNFSLSLDETENFIELLSLLVFFLPLLLSSKQAAKLDTPAQAAIKQKASSSSSKRQQHARQQHAARRQQRQRQQHAACGVLRQLQQQLACVVNCTIPRQHSTYTHRHTHRHQCRHTYVAGKKFFNKIKFNAAKC